VARKPKHRTITIKDTETQAVLGVVFLVLSIITALSLFIDSLVLNIVRQNLGVGVIVLSVILLIAGLRLLGTKNQYNSIRVIISLVLFGVIFLAWIHLFVNQEYALTAAERGEYGGIVGYVISRWFYETFSALGGIILLTPFLIITLGSALNLSPSQIWNGFVKGVTFTWKFLSWLFKNIKKAIFWLIGKKEEIKVDVLENKEKKTKKMVPEITGFLPPKQEEKTVEMKVQEKEEIPHKTTQTPWQTLLYPNWKLPPIDLLDKPSQVVGQLQNTAKNADIIEETFENFGIRVRVVGKSQGPTVTQYMLAIPAGTKVSKIEALAKDLTLALAAPSMIRIVAPIPGTPYIGIEVANSKPQWVSLKELLESKEAKESNMKIPLFIGKDVSGKCIIKDLQRMPHLLIAGATGSGKSVLINGIIMGLLYNFSPDNLRLLLVDPKMVELYGYNGIPHLLTPVITDMNEVLNALKWVLYEMERRYRLFKEAGTRNIETYNENLGYSALPYIVIIIDEMADLMLRHGVEVENAVVRITQMSRATGIHLILATQRPSVDVITGLIKANIPARIAMAVPSITDSRVILDQPGAETLLGRGDSLLKLPEEVKMIRLQAVYVKDHEIKKVLNFIRDQTDKLHYNEEIIQEREGKITSSGYSSSKDELFDDAVRVIVNSQRGSASLLQTKLGIGYARASRLIDEMEKAGIVSRADGNKPRKVLIKDADAFLQSYHQGSKSSEIKNVVDNNGTNIIVPENSMEIR